MNSQELGEKIARARLDRRMSQKTLADIIGVSRGYIAQIERGKTPSDDVFAKLVAILGIPLTEIIDIEQIRKENPEMAMALESVSSSVQFASDNLAPDKMLELMKQQEHNEVLADKVFGALGSMPLASGPNGWEKLSKGDRKLVQEIINRLLKSSRYGEGEVNG